MTRPASGKSAEFWDALRASIEDNPPIDFDEDMEWQCGFLLARRIQGVLIEHGYNPRTVKRANFREFLRQFAEAEGIDADNLAEQFWDVWEKIRTPEGVDPVAAAAAKVTGKPLEGDWATEVFARDATAVYEIALELAGGVGGGCFLPCRKIASALGCDAMRVSRLLNALVLNGYLVRVGAATKTQAQRFEVAK